jgi:hypothetical protein
MGGTGACANIGGHRATDDGTAATKPEHQSGSNSGLM